MQTDANVDSAICRNKNVDAPTLKYTRISTIAILYIFYLVWLLMLEGSEIIPLFLIHFNREHRQSS